MTKPKVRVKNRQFWKKQIKNWQESGLTQTEYCKQHDLSQHNLTYWKRRFVKTEPSVSLVQVNMKADFNSNQIPCASPLRLVVGNQYRVEIDRGFDPVALQQLLYTLKQL